jgi:CO/xanthine dehydrogenase FAD-binding subunit
MRIIRPHDLDGVLDALASHPGASLLAGGTDLMVEVNLLHRRPATVVSLRHVAELTRWEDGFIGAGVTWARLERGPIPALAELARTVGSPQIRAAGTLGGNLGTASPAGDALPFLAAVDATVVLASTRGERRLPWDGFLVGPKRNARGDDEVILGVEVPDVAAAPQAFAKVGVRQAMVIATVNCCVVRLDGRTRVALGSVGPTVLRIPAAETLVDDATSDAASGATSVATSLTPEVLAGFQHLVSAGVAPITDHRATEAYRRHAAGVLARRTLERCVAR